MNIYDYILIGVLVAALHRAVGYIVKHKGSCCGDCSQCGTNCNKREEDFHENHER